MIGARLTTSGARLENNNQKKEILTVLVERENAEKLPQCEPSTRLNA